jgi:uncharacterized protein (UPF0332 family)
MSLEYDGCLKRGKIKPFSRGKTLAPKEIEAAKSDLERATKTYEEGDYKWATVQLYYSMFHSARALLYVRNLREHSHYCLLQAMKSLYVDTKKIPGRYIDAFHQAKDLREDADYYNRWSEKGCQKLLKAAEEFLEKAKSIVK